MKYKIKLKKYEDGGRALTFKEWFEQNYPGQSINSIDPTQQTSIQNDYNAYLTGYNQNSSSSTQYDNSKSQRVLSSNDLGINNIPNTQFNVNNTYLAQTAANQKPIQSSNLPYQQTKQGSILNVDVTNQPLNYNNFFKGFNQALDATQALGNIVNSVQQNNEEKRKYLAAYYNNTQYNPNELGINNVPVYYQNGGPTPEKAKIILHDGTIRGKKITDKQRRYFGYISNQKYAIGGEPDIENLNNLFQDNSLRTGIILQPDQFQFKSGGEANDKKFAYNVLNAGEINGQKLTKAQKKHFTYVAEGKIPLHGHVADYKKQNGGFMKLNPNHEGEFTEKAKKRGMGVQEFAHYVLTHNDDFETETIREANFARNAKHFKHKNGGSVDINPEHRGEFTAKAKNHGMTVKAFAGYVLANKKDFPTKTVQQAVFAHNFTGKKKMADGGNTNIYIKPSHRGEFTEKADSHNMGVQQFANYVLNNKEDFPEDTIKQAVFAHNFSGRKMAEGGDIYLVDENFGPTPKPKPKYTFPSAYNFDMWHPDFHPEKTDSTAYKNMFYNALQNHNIDPNTYIYRANYARDNMNSIDNQSGPDAARRQYLQNMILANAVKDARGYTTQYQEGGGVPEVFGQNNGNAELEAGEVFQQRNGNILKVDDNDNTHEDGGSVQPNVDRVLEDTSDKRKDKVSKALKITPKVAKEVFDINIKSPVTHSKLYEIATKQNDDKLRNLNNSLEKNLDYLKNKNGGYLAQNSLDENLKLIQNNIQNQDIFDAIYDHQEGIKNDIDTGKKMKYGGKSKYKMADGGTTEDPNPKDKYKWFTDKWGKYVSGNGNPYDPNNLPKGYNKDEYIKDLMTVMNGVTGNNYSQDRAGLKQMRQDQYQSHPEYITDARQRNYWNTNASTDTGYTDPNRLYYDAVGFENNPRRFDSPEARDKFIKDMNFQFIKDSTSEGSYIDPTTGRAIYTTLSKQMPAAQISNPDNVPNSIVAPQNVDLLKTDISAQNQDKGVIYNRPRPTTPSTFSEPLQWYDTAANVMGFIDSLGREPINLEQLRRQPIQARQLNAAPNLNENLGDYNAALQQLPTSGVGFANQANLLGNKYRVDNQIIGQYQNANLQNQQRVDELNNQNQFQLDTTNLGLRDQFTNRVLQAKENQRQQKLASLDAIFNTMAQNRKLNREGNLTMQLTPYFNQYGQYNGNPLDLNLKSGDPGLTENIEDVKGRKYRVVRDAKGNVIRSTEVTDTKPIKYSSKR